MIEIRTLQESENRQTRPALSIGGEGIFGILTAHTEEREKLFSFLCGEKESDKWEAFLCRKEQAIPVTNIKEKLGCVPANLALYEDMTPSELLDFMGQAKGVAADRRYRQIKEAIELTRLEKHKHKSLSSLSPYVRRRILLAGALLGNPDMILCEEPFDGLNAAQTRELTELLSRIAAAKPLVLLSVTSDILSLCENVAVLSDGAVQYEGSARTFAETLSGTVKLSLTLSEPPSLVASALTALEDLEIISTCEEENRLVVRYAATRDLQSAIVKTCEMLGCSVRGLERLTPTLADRMGRKGGDAE